MTAINFDALERLATQATTEPSSDDDGDFRYRCHGCSVLYALAPECDPSAFCNDCVHRIAEDLGHGVLGLIALARRTEEAERECAAEREAALHAEREQDEAERKASALHGAAEADHRVRVSLEAEANDLEARLDKATARAESAERERDALRTALIHVAGLQIRRDADAVEVRAIRATANDLSAPFSDERVAATLVEMRAGDPRDVALDAAAARIAEVMRERDGLRAENRTLRRHLATSEHFLEAFRGLTGVHLDAMERLRAAAVQAERERDEARAAMAELQEEADLWREDCVQRMESNTVSPDRSSLDPAHVEAVQYIRDRLVREAAKLRGDGFTYLANERDREVAHLEVVLGEAKAAGQALSDGGTTEGA